jgi:protein-disulfide isomerase
MVLLAAGAVGCTSGETDGTAETGARLTTSGAGQLLSAGTSLFEPGNPLAALSQAAPNGPPLDEITVDMLGVNFGTEEAPIRMVEFYDYGCGYCKIFHEETRRPLHEEYVDPGSVFWKSIPFITGNWAPSMPVSLAAECARDQGQSYFVSISDIIFERQGDWKSASDPEALAEVFAEEAGLDMARYRSCVEDDEFLWRVQAQTNLAGELGIRGTPSFIIVGVGPVNGALPLETFRQVFDTILSEAAAGRF